MTSREKYHIIRKLDSGGMAEVFLGEAESIEGFKKRVAIKRILPHLVENKKFLAMFLDEARLSLRFNNANVVQTFDIGRSGKTYFVVMEYVDGTNLKQVIENLRENKQTLPLELAVFIVIEICRGLSYAHNFKDGSGAPLGIVHRDVSPPNILMSKQGEVKIVDFGLAKATSQLEKTDPGVVKGKFAYLSPEAAHTKLVDHRADIFACGIILWELLTGKRLFLGENDVQTVELVREAEVPSIKDWNADVPASLEEIAKKPWPEGRRIDTKVAARWPRTWLVFSLNTAAGSPLSIFSDSSKRSLQKTSKSRPNRRLSTSSSKKRWSASLRWTAIPIEYPK
jgi:serine/threonine protein kinase